MDRAELNRIKKLKFRDPATILRELRAIETCIDGKDLSLQVKNLRTNDLRNIRELRQAALFCYAINQRTGFDIRFSPTEASDYDFIATRFDEDTHHIYPVQLKELPPEELNPNSTIQNIITSLSKYSSEHLTVVIFLNRNGTFDSSKIDTSTLKIAALWFVSCISPDQSEWRLDGDFINSPKATIFNYPNQV